MPAFLTHKVAADNIRKEIRDPEIRRLIDRHEDAFYSGTQGGDYFYSYKYYSMWAGYRFKMFGWALHRARVKRFFIEGAQYLKDENPTDVGRAFFLGYITHYALDMYLHPLVRRLGPSAMSDHNIVEFAVDCMYALKNNVDPWKFDKAQFIRETYVETDEIDEFFSAMMRKIYYGFTLPPEPYHTTYRYFEQFHAMIQKTGKWDLIVKQMQDCVTMLKTRTMVYQPYEKIRDLYDYEEFYRLIDTAIAHALRMIDAVTGYWDGRHDISVAQETFFNVDMNGKTITPIEERKAFKRLYRRAPLVH